MTRIAYYRTSRSLYCASVEWGFSRGTLWCRWCFLATSSSHTQSIPLWGHLEYPADNTSVMNWCHQLVQIVSEDELGHIVWAPLPTSDANVDYLLCAEASRLLELLAEGTRSFQ